MMRPVGFGRPSLDSGFIMKISTIAPASLLLLAALPGDDVRAGEDLLPGKAQAILKTYCASCHSAGNAKGGFDYVLDRDKLVSRDTVKDQLQ